MTVVDEPDWLAERRREALADIARRDASAVAEVDEVTGPAGAGPAANLPDSFWCARPTLDHVRWAAHSRAVPADAVLGVVLARVAALIPPFVRLPAPVGSAGTLDLCIGLIGSSGAGKSSANRLGAELVPFDSEVIAVPIGSGEGLIEAYLDTVEEKDDEGKTRRVKRQVRRGVLALLDEGQALAELSTRKGSTLLPTIRSAWTGDTLGQANASEDRKRRLTGGEYRFTMVAGWQTEHAAALLDDVDGGTPQRFVFLAAEDPTIPDVAPDWPGPLPWQLGPRRAEALGLDAAVHHEIRCRALARSRGEVTIDPLDAHRDLSRLKVAGLLAILEDRSHVDQADWDLAGVVLDTSDQVRARIKAVAAQKALDAERASVAKHVRRTDAADRSAEKRAVEAMTKAIARHVHKAACDGSCQRRCVSRSTPGKYRAMFSVDDAITEAASRGWIRLEGDTIRPGEARPT